MKNFANHIASLAKRAQTHADAINDISTLIDTTEPEATARALLGAARKLPIEAVGYIIAPSLYVRLAHDAHFFRALGHLLTRQTASVEVSGVMLDCLRKAVRSKSRPWKRHYFETLRLIASDGRLAPRLRAKATRHLAGDPHPDVATILRNHLSSGVRDTIDAAAHVLAAWHTAGDPRRRGLDRLLVRWASRAPKLALASNGVLRGLVLTASGREVVLTIARNARSRQQRERIIGVVGASLTSDILAAYVRYQANVGSLTFECLLLSLFSRYPEQLIRLHKDGFFSEYLFVVGLAPYLESAAAGVSRIRQAVSSGKHRMQSTSSFMSNAQFPYLVTEKSPYVNPNTLKLGQGYETGFQIGDALYRDLITQIGNAEHWHGGVFVGFNVTGGGQSEMVGIQASGNIIGDTITFFSAVAGLPNPTSNLAVWMQQLRTAFLKEFAYGHTNYPFHGARSTPGITRQQRQDVMLSATAMYGMNIWYTWIDMLAYKYSGWAGTVGDIDELRCDGVMEFSYEEHGLRVCGGTDPNTRNQWNIALRGKNHAENHNDFHNNAYNPGELCPRIQAGDQGNDSRFVIPPPIRPVIKEFNVTPWVWFIAPLIYFDSIATYSYRVFVRVVVREKGVGAFHFAETEDPYGGMGTIVGDWSLISTLANQRVAAFWMGKTVSGPDFRGKNGTYEFRIQLIDQGGNVSDELATEQYIEWP